MLADSVRCHASLHAQRENDRYNFSGGRIMAARKKGKRAPARKSAAASNVIGLGHQIWLAGLGAVARAQREGPKVFESLVEEGSALEQRQRSNVRHLAQGAWNELRESLDTRTAAARGKASEALDNLEEIFQTRVQKALQQLGMPTSQEIGALSRKVNELNRSVQALTRSRPRAAAGKAPSAQEEAVF
jgi:poly(hydroxyalkanoate) granule-associated protein